MKGDLYEALQEYCQGEDYPFHMPGHKRQMHLMGDPYAIDITEIDGFDNLHHAEGILLEAERRAAELYGSEETHYLINGSTAGLLAAVSACTRRGDRILAARNCHKSVYHAAYLNGLRVTWLYPGIDLTRGICGSVDPADVRRALESCRKMPPGAEAGAGERIAAVILTSPTYDGVVSDIRTIARIVHEYGAILIVDEAHGAHFAMHPYFPVSAVACGADLVIHSVHKTLPSLTQTALIHVNGPRADRVRLRKYLDIYQSSSPSYVLMAGIDRCVCLLTERRRELYDRFICRLEAARQRLSQLRCLYLVGSGEEDPDCFDYDRSRLVVSTERSGLGGRELYRLLRETYHLQPEMAAERSVVLITSVADTREGLERLCSALEEIDGKLAAAAGLDGAETGTDARQPEMREGEVSGRGSGQPEMREGEVSGRGSGQPEPREGEVSGRGSGQPEPREGEVFGRGSGQSEPREAEDSERKSETLFGGKRKRQALAWQINEAVMCMEEAENQEQYTAFLSESAGAVSGEYVYLYPPGIPLLIPGERISEQLLSCLEELLRQGFDLEGLSDYTGKTIRLVKEQ